MLAALAAAAGACAVLIGATAALGQEHGHRQGDVHAARREPWRAGRDGPPVQDAGAQPPADQPGGWDSRRYDGYWSGGRWFYGMPQGPTPQGDIRPGFVPFRRGAYLPQQFQSYVVQDYARFHLRRPPYGYQWVQVGSEFVLISTATGLIFDEVNGY
jgi:Ni/Co efflux regulator RcnB